MSTRLVLDMQKLWHIVKWDHGWVGALLSLNVSVAITSSVARQIEPSPKTFTMTFHFKQAQW